MNGLIKSHRQHGAAPSVSFLKSHRRQVSFVSPMPMKRLGLVRMTPLRGEATSVKAVPMGKVRVSERTVARRRELESLRRLSAGWYDGEGAQISGTAVDGMSRLLALLTARLPEPRLYPTPSGAVRAEWDLGNRDISIEVTDFGYYAHVLDHSTGEDFDSEGERPDDAVSFLLSVSA